MKIGDKVRIVNSGQSYTIYREAAYKMNLVNWVYGRTLPENAKYIKDNEFIIVAIEELNLYMQGKQKLYGIENTTTGEQYIISKTGIKKI